MTFLSRREHRVCGDGATPSTCATQADALVTNHEYVAWPSPAASALYTEQLTRTAAPSDLERYNRSAFEIRYTATETRVLPPYTLVEAWRAAWQSLLLRCSDPACAGRLLVPEPWRRPALWSP